MAGWRILGTLVGLLAAAAAHAQTYTLKEAPLAGSYFHIKVHLDMTGELRIRQENKVNPLKQTALADHDFLERVLVADDEAGVIRKCARLYQSAAADISTDGKTTHLSFRPDRVLAAAHCYKDQPVAYCLKGDWTREELELSQHFDTLRLAGLLPGKEVAVGATWKVPNGAAQGLCAFDGLTANDLVCKLDDVKDNVATVSLTGTAEGIELGAAAKLKITGSYRFDLQAKRLTDLSWKQHDQRDQGPASPEVEADLTITLKRTVVGEATELNDFILTLVEPDADVPAKKSALWHREAKGRYELTYARDWQTVARDDDHLVLRLLDRGDFVAQATVTCWKKAADKHLSGDEFKDAMTESLGWQQEKLLVAKEEDPTQKGYWIYRVEGEGKLNGQEARQNFYLVAGPHGEQVVVAFTMTPNQVQKLAEKDLELVRNIVFPEQAP
jgi:hypothetical protein